MYDYRSKVGQNTSLGFDKKFEKLTNNKTKYKDAVAKIDKKTKQEVAKVLKRGYDVTVSDIIRGEYRTPGRLFSKTAVWGNEYSVQKSQNKYGFLSSNSGRNNIGHEFSSDSKSKKKRT